MSNAAVPADTLRARLNRVWLGSACNGGDEWRDERSRKPSKLHGVPWVAEYLHSRRARDLRLTAAGPKYDGPFMGRPPLPKVRQSNSLSR
jgi:hypothetical protein